MFGRSVMSNKNIVNKSYATLTDSELSLISKRKDLSVNEVNAINGELAARDLALAKLEKQNSPWPKEHHQYSKESYQFKWWHLILAFWIMRVISKIVHSSF